MKVLIVVSHPDDEVLGCGGIILKHISKGDQVYILILSDGETSRDQGVDLVKRESNARKVADMLGVTHLYLEKLPDNQCDAIPLLNVVKIVEGVVKKVQPSIVYTHNSYDLNIDHQIAFRAVLTACRPQPNFFVKRILAFEVLSSTEWQTKERSTLFCPTVYEDITDFIDKKIEVLKIYQDELREYPHPRSIEGVRVLAKYRGIESGYRFAEAFQLIRELKDYASMKVDGKKIATSIIEDLKSKFKENKAVLVLIAINPDKAILSFIEQKKKTAQRVGVELRIKELDQNITQQEVFSLLKEIGQDKEVDGIIVQLPLPNHLNEQDILDAIPKEKDVDALGKNAENLALSVETVKYIFNKYEIDMDHKVIVLNGFGKLVGMPLYHWFCSLGLKENVIVIKEDTCNKKDLIKKADILISGVGKANLIPSYWLKKGVIIIDFGCEVKQGRIFGDVEKTVKEKARIFTPTPGGTGPILVALIFRNLYSLKKANDKIRS